MDAFKNNAVAYVTLGYDAAATSIEIQLLTGAEWPAVSFNAIWWNYTDYPNPDFDPNREIVRVTNISGTTLTIQRAQETSMGGLAASTKNTASKTYVLMATLTAKTLVSDIFPSGALPTTVQDLITRVGTIASGTWNGTAVNISTYASGTLQAAQFPALTGDATTSAGSLAVTIANDAVSLAKMANIATDSIIGRATAGTGDPEVIAALPWADTGDVTRAADATVTAIAANAVTTAKILDANVTLAKIVSIATDSILGRATAGTGVPEVLTALPWANTGDVTRAADSNANVIANDAVTTVKMLDANVTLAKMANIANQTVLGNSSGGAAAPSAIGTLPNTVQDNITRLGTVTTGSLDAARIASGSLALARGGTNISAASATDLFNQLDPLTALGDWLIHDGTNSIKANASTIIAFTDDFLYGDATTLTPWTQGGVGAATITGEVGHPGILTIDCSTTSNGGKRVFQGIASLSPTGGAAWFECVVRIPDLSDATDEYDFRIGFGDTTGAAHVDGIYFEYDRNTSANWSGVTAKASSRTTRDTGSAVSAGTWVRLGFQVNAAFTSVQFYVNGSAAGAAVTTNLPDTVSNLYGLHIQIIASAGSVAATRAASIDYVDFGQILTTPR